MPDVAERRWVQGRKQPRTLTTTITVAYDGAELLRAEKTETLSAEDLADFKLAMQEAAEEWGRGTPGIRCAVYVEEPVDEAEGGEGVGAEREAAAAAGEVGGAG